MYKYECLIWNLARNVFLVHLETNQNVETKWMNNNIELVYLSPGRQVIAWCNINNKCSIFQENDQLDCVHISAYECKSTWTLTSAPFLHIVACKYVHLCVNPVYMSQSSVLRTHALVRMCTCISTCMYVYLTPHIYSIPNE